MRVHPTRSASASASASAAVAAVVVSLAMVAGACGGAPEARPSSAPSSTSTRSVASAPSVVPASSRPSAPVVPAAVPVTSHVGLPEPSGPLAVGVRRVDDLAPGATSRLWYPAVAGTGRGAAPAYVTPDVAAAYGLTADQVRAVEVRASTDATPAPASTPRPVVVLMPGWGQPVALSTSLALDLASNGYVVVTVDPATGSEDGNRLPDDPARPGRRLEQLSAALDFATGSRIGALAGPVDTAKVAAGGHSIAGAVAFEASLDDDRLRAVFDLDGHLHGSALTTPVTVPALVVEASGLDLGSKLAVRASTATVRVLLRGATHGDVTDLPCLAPVLGMPASSLGLGTIGCAGPATTSTLVRRFLDAALRDGGPVPSPSVLAAGLPGVAPEA